MSIGTSLYIKIANLKKSFVDGYMDDCVFLIISL